MTTRYRRCRSRPRSIRSSKSPLTTVVSSSAPCHTPKRAFLRLPQFPAPPLAPDRQSEYRRPSGRPGSNPPSVARTAPATDCCSRPRIDGSRRFSRSHSPLQHPPPLADSFAWTAQPPHLPAPLVAVFRLAATDGSCPAPLPGLRVFALVAVLKKPSGPQKPRNPAASPNAHSRRSDSADAVAPPDE